MENLDSVFRRIAKLLAISEDGRGNINESIAAAEMAQRIMDKYQIEHQDVIVSEMKRNAEFLEEEVGNGSKKFRKWVEFVAVGVSYFYNVRVNFVFNERTGEKKIQFSGFKTDVTIAKYIFEYLTNEIESIANREVRLGNISGYSKTEFKKGIAFTVQSRLKKKSEERNKEMMTTGRDLVVTKEALLEEKYGNQRFRVHHAAMTDVLKSGEKAGENIDLDRRGVEYNTATGQCVIAQ